MSVFFALSCSGRSIWNPGRRVRTWNQEVTTPADLDYARHHTNYQKIEDGNATGNGTPGLKTDSGEEWTRATSHPITGPYWTNARKIANKYNGVEDRYMNDAIKLGGMDFSDTTETCWIFGFSDIFDVPRFFDEFDSGKTN